MTKSARVVGLTLIAAILGGAYSFAQDEEQEKPKYSIKDVMKKANKGGLLKKVVAGDADQAEKMELLDMYISLVENKPPKGDEASWQRLAGTSALAAAKVAVGREGAEAELKEATNCAACHKPHKG
jgi:hypothetical protein